MDKDDVTGAMILAGAIFGVSGATILFLVGLDKALNSRQAMEVIRWVQSIQLNDAELAIIFVAIGVVLIGMAYMIEMAGK